MAGVTSFEELNAWKLSVELRDLVHALLASGKVRGDPTFCAQIRKSTSSAPANIAEGWGRFRPRQHAHHARIAKASLDETKNHLLQGRKQAYFSEEDFAKAIRWNHRALGATVRLLQYLDSCKGRLPWEDPPKRKPKRKEQDGENPEP